MLRLIGLRRRLRARAERWVDRRLPVGVPFTPTYVQVEVANRCNLSCIMCPIVELSSARPRKLLDAHGFAAIAGQFPALRRADLQGIGEPLLNPHVEDIAAWCSGRGIQVGFVTNGLLLDETRAHSILAAGVEHVVFSMDSVDPSIYARIRHGGRLDLLLANIRRFVEMRRERGLQRPAIGMMAVAMKENLDGLARVVEVAAELRVDALTIKGLNPTPNPSQKPETHKEAVAAIQAAALAAPQLAVTIACENDRSRLRCRWPWTAAYVTVEGDLTPCCNCADARVGSLGNVLQQPFLELWNATAYREFRRELRDGMPEICASCPDY